MNVVNFLLTTVYHNANLLLSLRLQDQNVLMNVFSVIVAMFLLQSLASLLSLLLSSTEFVVDKTYILEIT